MKKYLIIFLIPLTQTFFTVSGQINTPIVIKEDFKFSHAESLESIEEIPVSSINTLSENKPGNIDYEINIIKVDEWYFNIEITFSSERAKTMHITVTDYCTGEMLGTLYKDQQSVKHMSSYHAYDYPIRIQFRADNDNGTTTACLYIEAFDYGSDPKIITSNIKYESNNLDNYSKIEVFDMNGLLITTLSSIEEMDLFKSGTYLLRIHNNNGSITTKKIIK